MATVTYYGLCEVISIGNVMSQIRIFLSLILLLGVILLPLSAQAATLTCTTGSETFTPAAGDTVIATDSCAALTLNCTANNQCQGITVYAASTSVDINCTSLRSCYNSDISIGIPDTLPATYTVNDFDGEVTNFNLNCSGEQACGCYDRTRPWWQGGGLINPACDGSPEMTLKTFEAIKYQDINCTGAYSCVGFVAEFYNVFTETDGSNGSIQLDCGATDQRQCDTADIIIESAGAPYSCTGATCPFIGCAEPGCTTPPEEPPANNDPDGDGTSNYYDDDDDGDGIPDDQDNNPNQADSAPEQELLLSPKYHRFGSETISAPNCAATSTPVTYTVLNVGDDSKTLNGVPTLVGASTGEFSIINNTCTSGIGLAKDASCTFDVIYCPTSNGNKSAMVTIANNDVETPILTAALYSFESTADEAKRRIPAVLNQISISPAVTDGMLSVGTSYTFTVTLDGYDSTYLLYAALFACATDDTGRCGKYFSENLTAVEGPLSPSATALGSGGYSYEGLSSNLFTFSFSFTPSAAGDYVVRFYHKNTRDVSLAKRSISLLVPGGDVGLPAYQYDSGGRRLQFTAQ